MVHLNEFHNSHRDILFSDVQLLSNNLETFQPVVYFQRSHYPHGDMTKSNKYIS